MPTMPKDSPMFCGLPPDHYDIGTDPLFCLQCQSQQRFPHEFNSLYPICEQCDPLYVGLMHGTHFRRIDDQERSEHVELEEVYERSWVELPTPLVPLQAVRKSEIKRRIKIAKKINAKMVEDVVRRLSRLMLLGDRQVNSCPFRLLTDAYTGPYAMGCELEDYQFPTPTAPLQVVRKDEMLKYLHVMYYLRLISERSMYYKSRMFGPIGAMTSLSYIPSARYTDAMVPKVTLFAARRRTMRSLGLDIDEQLVLAMLWEECNDTGDDVAPPSHQKGVSSSVNESVRLVCKMSWKFKKF